MTRPIRWELIERNHDQLIKYATAIRVGTGGDPAPLHPQCLTSGLPSDARTRTRTIFIARYLRDRDRNEINDGLNLIES